MQVFCLGCSYVFTYITSVRRHDLRERRYTSRGRRSILCTRCGNTCCDDADALEHVNGHSVDGRKRALKSRRLLGVGKNYHCVAQLHLNVSMYERCHCLLK